MKLLWVISNWKRTGPLEPSLDLAAAIAAEGHDVHVAVGRAPQGEADRADVAATDRGLTLAATGATLAKHSSPLRDWRDARRLRHWIDRERPDAIVATQRNDHVLTLRAAAGADVPVVRLWFGDGHEVPDPRDAKALRRGAGALVFCEAAAAQLAGLGVPSGRIARAAPPLDVAALRERAGDTGALRAAAGAPADPLLVGIVARMQTHRRFEMLWEAARLWKARGVPAFLVAIGRGTHAESVAHAPVRALGLDDVVHFTGYLRGRAYATAVAELEAQILLVPGSDPTCRALREGMALGVPSIATRRGMLPEIVADGETGLLVDETPEALAAAVTRLASDRPLARTLGEAARARADAAFATPVVGRQLLALLERVG